MTKIKILSRRPEEIADEKKRLTNVRNLLASVHAKAKEAGVTEEELRKDVQKALDELRGEEHE